ncbi:MAG: succinate dehydrogenase [Actinomycetales bacterium]|nr:MAG: succinate dehydrogenase [Actinomycetales bacterium]
MAITGLIMIGFLLMHMYGNLKMFLGADAFNHYAHWLKGTTEDGGLMYPILPAGVFIWIFRAVLLLAVVLHVWSAAVLSAQTIKVRGPKYQTSNRLTQTYSSRTMRWGGAILGGFLIFHILQFTAKVVRTGFGVDAEPSEMVILSFGNIFVLLAYAIWMVLVCMHIRHGFWSAFTTLGANVSKGAQKVLNGLAIFVAVLLYIGFMVTPLAIYFGMIGV